MFNANGVSARRRRFSTYLRFCALGLIGLALLARLGVSAAAADVGQGATRCVPAWNQFSGFSELPSTVLTSMRGPDGFIYFGGRDGLYRAEGASLASWRPDFSNPTALPAGRVSALLNDGTYLWVATAGGLARFDPVSDAIVRVPLADYPGRQPAIAAMALFDGRLWLAVDGGVLAIDHEEPTAPGTRYTLDDASSLSVRAIAVYRDDIYAGGDDGLFRLQGNGRTALVELPTDRAIVNDLEVGPDGGFYVLASDALLVSKGAEQRAWDRHASSETPNLPEGDLADMTFDKAGRLWIASSRGLSRWDPGAASPFECRTSIQGSDRDQELPIVHIAGNLGPYMFIGTSGRGAAYAPLSSDVTLLIPGERFNPGLPEYSIWSSEILSDGRLLLGTSRGVYAQLHPSEQVYEAVAPDVLGDRRIYAIKEMPTGSVWVGTNQGAFVLSGERALPLPALTTVQGEALAPAVFAIASHEDRGLLATGSGLVVLDSESTNPVSYLRGNLELGLSGATEAFGAEIQRLWSIDASDDALFLAGDNMAFRIDLDTLTVAASTLEASERGDFLAGRVYAIASVGSDEVLLGTESGLVRTDPDFSQFETVTEINGHRLASVMSMRRDGDGAVWIGVANNGLFRRDPATTEWIHFTQSDGLITNGVSQLGMTLGSDGQVLVSNATGASILSSASIARRDKPPMTLFVRDEYSGTRLAAGDRMSIGPERRDIRLNFAIGELLEPGRHWIEYRFDDQRSESGWSSAQLGEDLTFLNLGPGNYEFEARLTSANGTASNPIGFSVGVGAFWWERQETYIGLTLLVVALALVVFFLRARAIERRYGLVANERKRIAQELHDTFLQDVFGARMLGRTLAAEQQAPDAIERAGKILSLLESATESVRKSVSELNALTDVPPISEAVRAFQPSAKFGQDMDIVIEENGPHWSMKAQRRFFVSRIVQEAINNACKHSNGRRIAVNLCWSWRALSITISDDGEGFDRNSDCFEAGFGLEAMDCMAEAARAKLNIRSTPGEGTTVSLQVARYLL